MRKVFFDTETSGLAPGSIGQLSAIIVDDTDGEARVTAKNYFFAMDFITDDAARICGRDLDFYISASKGRRFSDYAQEIKELFTDATLIAHNLKFDENFLSAELWRNRITLKPADRFDTMVYFKDICKIPGKYGKYKNPKLEELVDYFNIDKDKVLVYSQQLFKSEDTFGFHDSRYDTASMFVAFNVYKDMYSGTREWIDAFVKK